MTRINLVPPEELMDQHLFAEFRESELDPDGTMLATPWCGHYTATPEALQIIRTRIAEKIALKPQWYRYEGKPIA